MECADFWQHVPNSCRSQLQKISYLKGYKTGEIVFRQGDSFRGPYIVQKGIFKIYQLNEHGKEAILNFFFPGSIMAVLPLLKTNSLYPASCEAVRSGELYYIEKDRCKKLMESHPEMRSCLQEDFLSNAEFFKNKTALLMLHSTEERVLFFLNALGARLNEVYLNIPKNQIALYLGVSPESFSRAFSGLKKEGWISEREGYIKLLIDNETYERMIPITSNVSPTGL